MRSSRDWLPPVLLFCLFAAGWLLVGARANVPVVDDWVYAWSVEHFVTTHRLAILPISAIYPFALVVWGALFASIAGFSFGVLRASTVTLAIVGCYAVYLTLRELGCRRSTSMLGAIALALDPVFFAFSFSFMTEVPFASLTAVSLYAFVRSTRRNEIGWMWIGALGAIACFLIRPIGIALPIAVVPAVAFHREWRAIKWRLLAPVAGSLGAMAALQLLLPRLAGPLDGAAMREGWLRWWLTVSPVDYAKWNIGLLFEAVFPLAPLLLGALGTRRFAIRAGIAAIGLAVGTWLVLGHVPTPLPDWQTWSLQDIAARAMIGGSLVPSAWSTHATGVMRVLGLLTVGSLVVSAARGVRRRPLDRPLSIVVALVALHVALINVLWLYNDRYYMVLAPMLAVLGACAIDKHAGARWLASCVLAIWAAIAITGTRDMLAFNDAVANTVRDLEASGIPRWQVDGGWSQNGWRLYAHPFDVPAGTDPRWGVPFVTSTQTTKYSVTNTPIADADVLRVVPLPRATWQATHELFVVRRR